MFYNVDNPSIFAVSCDGDITVTLPDNLRYGFAGHDASRSVHVRSLSGSGQHAKRKRSPLTGFIEKAVTSSSQVLNELYPFSFLAGPLPAPITDQYQAGYVPRCPAKVPFGLVSIEKPGARAPYFNGCGPENGIKVPDLKFTECCNQHDLCYGR
jgi:hypothetical protein